MAEQTGIDVVVRAILESRGFDQLQEKLKAAREGGKEAAGGINEFSEAITSVGEKLLAATGITLGLAEAVSFLKESFGEAVRESRLLDQMASSNETLAKASRDEREANEEWLRSVMHASGIVNDVIVPSYLRLVAVTGSVSEAQRLTQIAAGAAARGLGELGEITQALIRYYETGQTQTRGFGAVLKALIGDADSTSAGLTRLEAKFGDAGRAVQNAGLAVDRAKVGWQETKEAVGGLALSLADQLSPILKKVAEGFAGLYFWINMAYAGIKQWADFLPSLGRAAVEAASGHIDEAKRIMALATADIQKTYQDALDRSVAFMAKIEEAWDTATTALNKEGGPFHPPPAAGNALEELRKKYQILADSAVQLGMEEIQARLAVLKVYQQMANDPAVAKFPDLQAEANKRLVAAVNDLGRAVAKEAEDQVNAEKRKQKAIQDTNDQWLADEKKRIDAERKGVDEAVKLEVAKYKALERGDIDYLQRYQAYLQQQLVIYKGTAEEKARLDRELATTTIRLEQVKQDAYLATAGAAVAFASAAFGQNKAVMIAEGILNAYAAYARAQKDYGYPYSLIIGGLAFATTMAQVAAMEPIEPGTSTNSKGFDNPQNDFAAVMGGRKWARDYINLTGAGFAEELRRGDWAGRASTVNNSSVRYGDRQIHLTLNAGMGTDRTALIRFVKNDLVPVLNRIDRQRDIQ